MVIKETRMDQTKKRETLSQDTFGGVRNTWRHVRKIFMTQKQSRISIEMKHRDEVKMLRLQMAAKDKRILELEKLNRVNCRSSMNLPNDDKKMAGAKEYVDKQLETLKRYDSAPKNLSLEGISTPRSGSR